MYSIDRLTNTYKQLEQRIPPTDQEFTIYAYFLYSEPKDGIYGKQIFLGAYPTKKKAFTEATAIIKATGHDSIYICETCSWENIDSVKRFDRTFMLDPTVKFDELEKQFDEEIIKKEEARKAREIIANEIELQGENELNPTTIDHYVHNWFNAIQNKISYEYHKSKMIHYEQVYEKRRDKIRKQYALQPEFEDQWLALYEQRLRARNEEDVFIMMREGHKAIKDEVLN